MGKFHRGGFSIRHLLLEAASQALNVARKSETTTPPTEMPVARDDRSVRGVDET
jgi:hypothetical protein